MPSTLINAFGCVGLDQTLVPGRRIEDYYEIHPTFTDDQGRPEKLEVARSIPFFCADGTKGVSVKELYELKSARLSEPDVLVLEWVNKQTKFHFTWPGLENDTKAFDPVNAHLTTRREFATWIATRICEDVKDATKVRPKFPYNQYLATRKLSLYNPDFISGIQLVAVHYYTDKATWYPILRYNRV